MALIQSEVGGGKAEIFKMDARALSQALHQGEITNLDESHAISGWKRERLEDILEKNFFSSGDHPPSTRLSSHEQRVAFLSQICRKMSARQPQAVSDEQIETTPQRNRNPRKRKCKDVQPDSETPKEQSSVESKRKRKPKKISLPDQEFKPAKILRNRRSRLVQDESESAPSTARSNSRLPPQRQDPNVPELSPPKGRRAQDRSKSPKISELPSQASAPKTLQPPSIVTPAAVKADKLEERLAFLMEKLESSVLEKESANQQLARRQSSVLEEMAKQFERSQKIEQPVSESHSTSSARVTEEISSLRAQLQTLQNQLLEKEAPKPTTIPQPSTQTSGFLNSNGWTNPSQGHSETRGQDQQHVSTVLHANAATEGQGVL